MPCKQTQQFSNAQKKNQPHPTNPQYPNGTHVPVYANNFNKSRPQIIYPNTTSNKRQHLPNLPSPRASPEAIKQIDQIDQIFNDIFNIIKEDDEILSYTKEHFPNLCPETDKNSDVKK